MLLDVGTHGGLTRAIDELVAANLPPFMMWSSPGNWHWHRIYALYPDHQVAILDTANEVVGAVNSVPLSWSEGEALPGGYDDVVTRATTTGQSEPTMPTATCLLSISVRSDHRRQGVPAELLSEMKRRARALKRPVIVVPLRPTRKAEHPGVSMTDYAAWKTAEGEPFDPWIRTHVRLGGRILGVAERSLVVSQPRARWEEILGRSMELPGEYEVAGALATVVVDERGIGTYAEPNVWIAHDCR